jgi:MFS family permease
MLWIAGTASYVGTWMQDVATAWVLTAMTTAPLVVALLTAATSAPLFLFGLVAGAAGDVVDRRVYLVVAHSWLVVTSGGLALITALGAATPAVLIAFAALTGIGLAMIGPVWDATVPHTVASPDVPAAIALGSIAVNLARSLGPTLGGLVIALAGPWLVFVVNASVAAGVVVVVLRWRPPARDATSPSEPLRDATATGLRYVRHAPAFRAVLVRAALFIFFGSALWSLLPVVGHALRLDAVRYGGLVGAAGVAGVATALALPRLRARTSADVRMALGAAGFAAAALALSALRSPALAYAGMIVGGAGWLTAMNVLNVASQRSAAPWVRARALAVFAIVFQGASTVGAVVWGTLAQALGVGVSLQVAATGLVAGIAAAVRYPLAAADGLDLTPARHWPSPMLIADPAAPDAPVQVTVEYRVSPEHAEAFIGDARALETIRRRDGAVSWTLRPGGIGAFLEEFVVPSWAAHLRQHERVTVTDRVLEARVRAWHVGDAPIVVRHRPVT